MLRCEAPGCVRGIVHRVGGFGDPCKLCGGLGEVSFHTIAKRIGENEATLRRILKPHRAMRVKTTARICAKIMSLVEPPKPKQPALFES